MEEVDSFGEDDGLGLKMGTAVEVRPPEPTSKLLVSRRRMTLPSAN